MTKVGIGELFALLGMPFGQDAVYDRSVIRLLAVYQCVVPDGVESCDRFNLASVEIAQETNEFS